jgi:Recombination endonuclease VII
MGVSCLPTYGPYSPDEPPFTLAAADTTGRYHVWHPRTGLPVCREGPVRRPNKAGVDWVPCPTGTPLLGVPVRVTDIPPGRRCADFRAWPAYVKRPATWPLPLWPGNQPPRWYIWWTLYEVQHERCAACDYYPPHHIDHDHGTKLVRGLLCRWCNSQEGNARRRPDRCTHQPPCYAVYRASPPAAPYQWLYPRR